MLCAKHFAKGFIHIISFKPPNNPFFPILQMGKQGFARLSNLSKATLLIMWQGLNAGLSNSKTWLHIKKQCSETYFFFLRLFLKVDDVIHVQGKTFKHFKRIYGNIIITTLKNPVLQFAFWKQLELLVYYMSFQRNSIS